MILLDTNALIWLGTGHRRTRALARSSQQLCISPASLLELAYLEEVGRLRARGSVVDDPRWFLDEPTAAEWFEVAVDLSWTRDVFDRLIVAHALTRRLRLATGDAHILAHLPARQVLEL